MGAVAPALLVPLAIGGLLLNALVWGVSWWPFRYLQALGLHPLWTTALMYLVATACVLALRPGALLEVGRQKPLWVILLASGMTNAAFNWAVSIGDVVRVVLLFYLAPLWAVLLARWLLGEMFSAALALRVALALTGAALVLGVDVDPSVAATTATAGAAGAGVGLTLPDGLGVLGGIFFALVNVMLRREAHRDNGSRALAMFLGGALVPAALCIAASVWLPVGAGPALQALAVSPPPPSAAWVWPVLGLSLVFLAGNLALQFGAGRLPAQVTAVVMPMEVVFASVTAVWWGGEALRWPTLVGGALILSASLLAARDSQPPA